MTAPADSVRRRSREQVVVTGADGQVGRALRPRIPEGRFLSHGDLDVTDEEAVAGAVADASVIVHLAAFTNVDGCERDPDRAFAVNGEGTRNVVQAAADVGARVVYLSTDYVFDGERAGDYAEDDHPAPASAYGRSKLEGERFVAKGPDNLVVRTSWVFGDGHNFIRTILSAAALGGPLRVVDDQRGRPTWAEDLADALVYLVGAGTAGVVHVTGDGAPGSWADVADFALKAVGHPKPVERIDTESYRRVAGGVVAPRPANSVLSLELARRLGVPLGDWRTSLERYVGTLS